jgi:hypothetical protein
MTTDNERYDPKQHNHKQREELWPESRHQSEQRKALKATGRFYGEPSHGWKERLKKQKVKRVYRMPRLMPDGTIKEGGS